MCCHQSNLTIDENYDEGDAIRIQLDGIRRLEVLGFGKHAHRVGVLLCWHGIVCSGSGEYPHAKPCCSVFR